MHPNTAGALIVADSLLAFFRRDPAATPWFLRPTTAAGDPRPRLNLSVSPNPARGAIRCAFAAAQGQAWALEVLDVAGRRVRALASGTGEGGSLERAWDGQDDRGKPLPAGVYYVRATVGEGQETRRVVRLR